MLSILRTKTIVARSVKAPVISLARNYHDNIIDHYENPRNVGSLDKNKKTVGTGLSLQLYV